MVNATIGMEGTDFIVASVCETTSAVVPIKMVSKEWREEMARVYGTQNPQVVHEGQVDLQLPDRFTSTMDADNPYSVYHGHPGAIGRMAAYDLFNLDLITAYDNA